MERVSAPFPSPVRGQGEGENVLREKLTDHAVK
jgi:hypothetical protein